MTATLRTIHVPPLRVGTRDLADASTQLIRALVDTAPAGCDVATLIAAGEAIEVPGLREVREAPLARRELLTAWQLGVGPNAGGALVHSPTLAAPLTRHDRSNDGEQTVVTLWDLAAWEAAGEVGRSTSMGARAMMKRVVRFADAVVVPSFAHADRADAEWRLGDRIRVIPGAPSRGFRVPSDDAPRARDLDLPDSFVAVPGEVAPSERLLPALRAVAACGEHVVVFHTPAGDEATVIEAAEAAGIPAELLHVLPLLDAPDRAVLLQRARALVVATARTTWPWRVIEALAVGTPVVAADAPVLVELIGDGGVSAPVADLGDALCALLAADAQTARVRAADRGRSFSWGASAEQIWRLHAEL